MLRRSTSKPMASTGKTRQPAFPRLPRNRTCCGHDKMDAFDPKRTSATTPESRACISASYSVPRQNRWSLQQLDSPRIRNVVSNVANEEMRYRQNRVALPLEAHSATPALRAGRMDRSGRPEVDNDIVEQYNNPRELALPRAP